MRVAKTKWSKEFHSIHTTYDLDRIKDILNGMRKYEEIEKGYNYVIAKIQTTTAIINYIEQKDFDDAQIAKDYLGILYL